MPVGFIYSTDDISDGKDPQSLFGGEWTRITDTFLYASAETGTYRAGQTGGEKTHTLTVDEMPSHNHDIYYRGVYTMTSTG